jgi:hypothetical protein
MTEPAQPTGTIEGATRKPIRSDSGATHTEGKEAMTDKQRLNKLMEHPSCELIIRDAFGRVVFSSYVSDLRKNIDQYSPDLPEWKKK